MEPTWEEHLSGTPVYDGLPALTPHFRPGLKVIQGINAPALFVKEFKFYKIFTWLNCYKTFCFVTNQEAK
jgi:hypothetical protein